MSRSLHETLSQIADRTSPTDLLPRSLARAHRIRRNRALATAVSAAVVVALAIGVAGQLTGRPVANPVLPGPATTGPTSDRPTPTASSSPSPEPSPTASASAVPPPAQGCGEQQSTPNSSPALGSPVPGSGPMPGLVGSLYFTDNQSVVRQTASGAIYVVPHAAQGANVSPDGRSLAVIRDDSKVQVTDQDGRNARTLMTCGVDVGFEPAWSPDSSRFLTLSQQRDPQGRSILVVINVSTGTVTSLPHNLAGIHFLWSADGQHLGYATGDGHLGVADADGGNARIVPLIGDPNRAVNPRNRSSFDPYSISPDGKRMAVILHLDDEPVGDIGRSFGANAVIDTTTGADVPLPVSGEISGVLFQPDAGMVIRTTGADHNTLTFVNAAGTVTGQVAEPAYAKGFGLLDYRTT